MTNDGHNGDNVDLGPLKTTLKEVCVTPLNQPNQNVSNTTYLAQKVVNGPSLWSLVYPFGKS